MLGVIRPGALSGQRYLENKMDLSEFTRVSLLQIAEGVSSAKDSGAFRAIGGTQNTKTMTKLEGGLFQDSQGHIYSVVEFDVAVTVGHEVGGGAGVKLSVFSASGEAKRTGETVSRVKFSVPISFMS